MSSLKKVFNQVNFPKGEKIIKFYTIIGYTSIQLEKLDKSADQTLKIHIYIYIWLILTNINELWSSEKQESIKSAAELKITARVN